MKNPYAKFTKLLRALPEEQQMLAANYLRTHVGPTLCGCAFGAVYPNVEELDSFDLMAIYAEGSWESGDEFSRKFYEWVRQQSLAATKSESPANASAHLGEMMSRYMSDVDEYSLNQGGHVPPTSVQAACRMGLALASAGYGGRGLTPGARELAYRMACGEAISGSEATTLSCYFARFSQNQRFMKSVREKHGGAASVSWLLRGGDTCQSWVGEIAFWERPLPRRRS